MAERFANWWKNLARDGLPPNSISAYVFALCLIAVSAMIHAVFVVVGGNVLPYAAYYPATLLTSLVAGAGAGVFSILLSLAIVLWAFPTPEALQGANVALFLLCSAATVGVAELYRSASRRLHEEERKRALLMRELEHRGKNTFAIVQSIVSQTLQNRKDIADTIIGRIKSVSATNDILTRSDHQTAGLHAILARELDPYDRARIILRGPDVQLVPELARSFALIAHELATNAVKYGALCNPGGRLSVEWFRDGARLSLVWTEENGPAIDKPFEPGFGARLVTRLLKSHGGDITPEFRPDGLRVRMSVVLPPDTNDPPAPPFADRRAVAAR
jgi:two-component sensor histidine kinase